MEISITRLFEDYDWLYEMYWEHDLATWLMGELAGCTRYLIEGRMKKFEIPFRSASERTRVSFVDSGRSRLQSEMASKRVGENAANWRGGPVKRVCEHCNVVFSVKRYVIKNGGGKFCSIQCKGLWQSNHFVGSNNPNWNGGSNSYPYSISFNGRFKNAIRERDGYRCVLCHKVEELHRKHCVHHIDYDKQNTTAENCCTLCNDCNLRVNSGREEWQRILSEMIGATV